MSREPLGLCQGSEGSGGEGGVPGQQWAAPPGGSSLALHTQSPGWGRGGNGAHTYSRRWEPGVLGCTCHSARHSRSRRPARLPGLRCPTAARGSSLAERGTKIKRSVLRGTSRQLQASGENGEGGAPPRLHPPEGVQLCSHAQLCSQLGQPLPASPLQPADSTKVQAGHQKG